MAERKEPCSICGGPSRDGGTHPNLRDCVRYLATWIEELSARSRRPEREER